MRRIVHATDAAGGLQRDVAQRKSEHQDEMVSVPTRDTVADHIDRPHSLID